MGNSTACQTCSDRTSGHKWTPTTGAVAANHTTEGVSCSCRFADTLLASPAYKAPIDESVIVEMCGLLLNQASTAGLTKTCVLLQCVLLDMETTPGILVMFPQWVQGQHVPRVKMVSMVISHVTTPGARSAQ